MRFLFYPFVLSFFNLISFAQNKINKASDPVDRPRLIVGIVVDQMRWDYLYRFQDRYSNNGFNRILKEGFTCENTFIPYTPTITACGHSCIYTGSVPAMNGIISNAWFSRALNRIVYCTDDSTVKTIGSQSVAGRMSPVNLWTTTITDELRLATNFKSKVIGIALKDRGAILPAGHSANAAYWFDDASGGWITGSYYMNDLPGWLKNLNSKKLPDKYMKQNWNTLYPDSTYSQSTADDKPYEYDIPGEDNSFPHDISRITTGKYNSFRSTPFGNTYTFESAKAAIEGEGLGKANTTDFLAVSFSSTDYIGHGFGPNSIEVEDTYLRFDKDLSEFLQWLDSKIGKGQYLLFLSADHGVVNIPAFLKENKLPAGTVDESAIRADLNTALQQKFGISNLITQIINYQIYLDYRVIQNSGKDEALITQFLISILIQRNEIANAFDLHNLQAATLPDEVRNMVANGYNQKLSGDIQFIYKPGWIAGMGSGTTHGAWNPYDAHIPLLWYGWKIKAGKTNRQTYMTDIAPTLAALLRIQMPSGNLGKVIEEVGR